MKWHHKSKFEALSPYQIQVAGAIAEGYSNTGIAARLGKGTNDSVSGTVRIIYRKLGLTNDKIRDSRVMLANMIIRAELE